MYLRLSCILILLWSSVDSYSQSSYSFITKHNAFVSALIAGENGHIYYSDYNTFKIKELDGNGTQVNEFGVTGPGSQEFEAADVTWDNNGNLQITDYHFQRIQVYTPSGTFVKTISRPGGILSVDLANDADGTMYIVEAVNHRVLVLDKDGNFIKTFGSEGTSDGTFKYPAGIAVTSDRIYVTDGSNNRIQVFDKNSNFLFKFGIGSEPVQVTNPRKILIIDSIVYVSDGNNYIRYYDLDGNYLGRLGGGGSTNETFSFIADIYEVNGKLYVADYYNHYIKIFSPTKQTQFITFNPLSSKTYGDAAFILEATASSGLDIVYTSSDPSIASISGKQITIHSAGTVLLTASQPGNQNYLAANPVMQELRIEKASQSISFPAINEKTWGDPTFALVATSSSDLPVTFSVPDNSIVLLVNNKLIINGTGSVLITASQAGNTSYSAALSISNMLVVNKKSQTIFFESIPVKKENDDPFQLNAISTSDLNVNISIDDPSIATISPLNEVTILKPGQTIIRANQEGNDFYKAATEVTHLLQVDVVTGIESIPNSISIYPNPCYDLVNIQAPALVDYKVQLHNSLGNLLPAKVEKVNNALQIDVRGFPKGIFFIILKDNSSSQVFRLLKE